VKEIYQGRIYKLIKSGTTNYQVRKHNFLLPNLEAAVKLESISCLSIKEVQRLKLNFQEN